MKKPRLGIYGKQSASAIEPRRGSDNSTETLPRLQRVWKVYIVLTSRITLMTRTSNSTETMSGPK